MTILTEGSTPALTATPVQLRSWISRVRAPYTTTLDSVDEQLPMEMYFNRPKDTYVIIDLHTMVIERIFVSDVNGAIRYVTNLLQQ